jgi:hypothetical protein
LYACWTPPAWWLPASPTISPQTTSKSTRLIPRPDAAPVEEHLLVCEERRERLAEWDGYVRAMRVAMEV